MPVLVHNLAYKQEDKFQGDVPVFALYIKNAKALQMESMQNEAPFWRERIKAANFGCCLCGKDRREN